MTTKVAEKKLRLKGTSGGSAISCRISCRSRRRRGYLHWYIFRLGGLAYEGSNAGKKGSTQGWELGARERTARAGFLSALVVTDCTAPHALNL